MCVQISETTRDIFLSGWSSHNRCLTRTVARLSAFKTFYRTLSAKWLPHQHDGVETLCSASTCGCCTCTWFSFCLSHSASPSLTIPRLCHVSLFLHPFLVSSCTLVCISVIVFVCYFLLCPPWFISRFCSAVLLRCFHSTLTSCVYLSLQFSFSPCICVLSLSDIGP